jgi:3-oxoacyl-[acyl-carrier protein] reductase
MSEARVVAITGASAGIGRATALRMARQGCAIAACARRGDRLDTLAGEIGAGGGRALTVVADVTSELEMVRFVERTMERFGRLDVMMCNAGFGVYGAIDDISADQMRKLMDVNYFGTFYAARAALPVFRKQGRGHIVIVSSIVGKRGVPYVGAYSATKFAQVGMAECLRSELAGSSIHVSVVCPISTTTEFVDVMTREREATSADRSVPFNRWKTWPRRSRARSIIRFQRSIRTSSRAGSCSSTRSRQVSPIGSFRSSAGSRFDGPDGLDR